MSSVNRWQKYLSLSAFLLIFSCFLARAQPLPEVVAGTLERIPDFASRFVTPRHVDVWLPPGYTPEKKYGVWYFHDGQMLFDAGTTWNKLAWDIDDVFTGFFRRRKTKEVIVVGIWNGGATRHADYFPQKAFEQLRRDQQDTIYAALRPNGEAFFKGQQVCSDNYLKFIVSELKPVIDARYATLTDAAHTVIAGSSMGGLISLYALCEYPEIFGTAVCMSTHWPGLWTLQNNPIPAALMRYLVSGLPDPKTHKLYMDCGDQSIDALYPPIQRWADAVIRARGYHPPNWRTRYYPGTGHGELFWKKRLPAVLKFVTR
jgi:enterochelin esterase-like enzyme